MRSTLAALVVLGSIACGAPAAPSNADGGVDGSRGDAGEPPGPCSTPADCDDDNPCTDDSCTDATCAHAPSTDVCRPAVGECDVEEVCAAGVCPADALASASTECRAAMDTCDAAETCTGSSAVCPAHDPAVLADCGDHDACTADACDAATGCASVITAALGRALLSGSPDGALVALPIATSSGTVTSVDYTICPDGPDLASAPPRCAVELDGTEIALDVSRDDATALELVGTVPVRVAELPVDYRAFTVPGDTTAVLDGSSSCPGDPIDYAIVPFQVSIRRVGWPTVSVTPTPDEASLGSALHFCGGGASASILSVLRAAVRQSIQDTLHAGVTAAVESEICLRADPGPCPSGSSATPDGICRPDAEPTACIARTESAIDHLVAASCIE